MNLYLEVNNGECSLYLSFYIIILRIFKKLQYSLYCYANPLFEFVSGISILFQENFVSSINKYLYVTNYLEFYLFQDLL